MHLAGSTSEFCGALEQSPDSTAATWAEHVTAATWGGAKKNGDFTVIL